jgi:hypothetical protein
MPMVYTITSSIAAHIPTHYPMLMLMVYTLTSSIRAHIYKHYTMLMPMVYTMTSSIGAHIYTLHYAHAHEIHDDEFDSCAYIYTTLCSCLLYTR